MRADDATARSLLVQAILSTNVKEQVELIGKLETVESDVVPAVLNAWRDGAVYRSRESRRTEDPLPPSGRQSDTHR